VIVECTTTSSLIRSFGIAFGKVVSIKAMLVGANRVSHFVQ